MWTRCLRVAVATLALFALGSALGVLCFGARAGVSLDTAVAAQGSNSAPVRLVAPYRVTVGAAAVQLTASGNVRGLVVKAICPGQTIYVGTSSAVTTATGYPLADGETLTLEVQNANQIFAIASAAAQAVAILPFERY